VNLPFIFDVIIGLVFVYLILSLLASEIQEMLTAILQWRAEHLRKSIEILLAGDVDSSDDTKVVQLANQIYANPLIKSMNQEAKGFFPMLPRQFIWFLGSTYRIFRRGVTKKLDRTGFGNAQHSAPSYIDSKTFSASLIDTLKLPTFTNKLTEIRLEKFKEHILNEVKNILIKLQGQIQTNEFPAAFTQQIAQDYEQIKSEYETIIEDFKNNKSDIDISINRMKDSLDQYIENFQAVIECEQDFLQKILRRLKYLRKDIFDDVTQTIALGKLKPTVTEVIQSVNQTSAVYQEIVSSVKDKDSEIYQIIQGLVHSLPKSVVANLEMMAKNANTKAKTVEESVDLLGQEIATSFDKSMARASGVYKRNSKGVAFLIGLILAIGTNADTFYMINRLSKDAVLRDAIVAKAVEIAPQPSSTSDPNSIDTNQILENTPLPIGWSSNNLHDQMSCKRNVFGCETFQIRGLPIFNIVAVVTGWIITGIAVAMGAPFWFDLLGKVINVRNTGKPVKTAAEDSSGK
jgi:hypothetical protein